MFVPNSCPSVCVSVVNIQVPNFMKAFVILTKYEESNKAFFIVDY